MANHLINFRRNSNFNRGVAGRLRLPHPGDFDSRDSYRNPGHRVHRATDMGQQFMRDQAKMNYLMEQMLIIKSPIQIPDPEEE
jgi:hypothetical protein